MAYDTGFNQTSWLSEATRVLKKGGHFIIFNDWENMSEISSELKKLKVKVKCLGHWQKTNPQPAEWKRRFVTGREYFLHAIKNGKYTFNVDKLNKGVFEMGLTKGSEKKLGKHPNQKPLNLMEQLIKIVTNEGDIVLDCFAGSGSTNLACKNTNRSCIGMELDKTFSELARRRLE
jgi:DNA modification methylase